MRPFRCATWRRASTSRKNPAYRDVLYVEELIGPQTVNTMPLTTIDSFREHGRVRLSLEQHLAEAQAVLAALEQAGIHYSQVTPQLQEEGCRSSSIPSRSCLRVLTRNDRCLGSNEAC